ncbi:hypothetical protein B0H11DRAFT_2213441 [Mycena galericulata]|nr:hypothetical protein B0H11DRAFT_2213441 [Mycena galericulata]
MYTPHAAAMQVSSDDPALQERRRTFDLLTQLLVGAKDEKASTALAQELNNEPKRLVYVSGLDRWEDIDALRDHLSQVGEIEDACEYVQPEGNYYAVLFHTAQAAADAVKKFHNTEYNGRVASVRTGGRSLTIKRDIQTASSTLREISEFPQSIVSITRSSSMGPLLEFATDVEFATEMDAARAFAVLRNSRQLDVEYCSDALEPISPSSKLDDDASDRAYFELVMHAEHGTVDYANQFRKQLQNRGVEIPWHHSFERLIADTSPSNLAHVKDWFALLPPGISNLELQESTYQSLSSTSHSMNSIKELGLLAASKGYLEPGLTAVRHVVLWESPQVAVQYIIDWEDTAIRGRHLFPIPIFQVLGSLYKRGLPADFVLAGRPDGSPTLVAQLLGDFGSVPAKICSCEIQLPLPKDLVLRRSAPVHLGNLQLSWDLLRKNMREVHPTHSFAKARPALNIEQFVSLVEGPERMTMYHQNELALLLHASGPQDMGHLEDLCARIESHQADRENVTRFWIMGLMKYLADNQKYEEAVFLFDQYCIPFTMVVSTKNRVVSSYRSHLGPSSNRPYWRPVIPRSPNVVLLLRCLIRLCPSPTALEALFAEFRHTFLDKPNKFVGRKVVVTIFFSAFEHAGLTDQLKSILQEFGVGMLPYPPIADGTLMQAYAATSNVPKILQVLESRRQTSPDVFKAGYIKALGILKKAGLVTGIDVVQTYYFALGPFTDGPGLMVADVPKVLALLDTLKTLDAVDMDSVYADVVSRFEESACSAGAQAVIAHRAGINSDISTRLADYPPEEVPPLTVLDNYIKQMSQPDESTQRLSWLDLVGALYRYVETDAILSEIPHVRIVCDFLDALQTADDADMDWVYHCVARRFQESAVPAGVRAVYAHRDRFSGTPVHSSSPFVLAALEHAARSKVGPALEILDQNVGQVSRQDLMAVLYQFLEKGSVRGALEMEVRLWKDWDPVKESDISFTAISETVRALWRKTRTPRDRPRDPTVRRFAHV